jgi:NADPH:quinone reductase-like Zn-dependent oxidoreductase
MLFVDVTGTAAEYVRVPEKNVVRVPSNISLEEAAGIPLAGCTAW